MGADYYNHRHNDPDRNVVARTRGAAAWATATAVTATETAFRFGGSSSVFDHCALQRRLRDINVIAQHFLVKPDALTATGALLVGQPLDIPVF